MRRAFLAVLAMLTMASAAAAQDIVRLRSGKVLSGTLILDEADREGFKVQRWDTGGTVYIRWTQLTEADKIRLLNKSPDAVVTGPALEVLDGVRLLTPSRIVIGVLIREDAHQLSVKTKDSRTPVVVPKNDNVQSREDKVKISEADAYSPDEMIDRRLARANEKDYGDMLKIGQFAAALRLYEKAKEFYQKAAAADPSRKDEIERIIADNEVLIKEGKASAILREVKDLTEKVEYAKAIELAKKLLAEFADTEVAKHNKDLVATLEKEAKEWDVKKAEKLAEKVPEMYKAKRSALLSQYASAKYKISEARGLANKIDEEVLKDLAQKLKSTHEEITAAWAKRDQAKRTVSYGSGSWIVKGGQDGGLDTDQKYTPPPPTQRNQGDMVDPFTGGTVRRKQPQGGQQGKPIDLGKKLETSAEWWTNASSAERKNFLEAEYAKNSSAVQKEIKTKKCGVCLGEGMMKSDRMGVVCNVKCPRCHGAKEDEIIVYW